MKQTRILMIFTLSLALVLLSACELPTKNPTSSPAELVFETAQAAAAGTLTQQALLAPTLTIAPTFTNSISPPETTMAPPPPNKPMVSVSKETNCRIGPDTTFQLVGGLLPGVMAEVVALDTSGKFYYIRNPQDTQNFCWLWGFYATLVGDGSTLPRFTPMPTPTITITPTPVPNFSIVSSRLDGCVGDWFEVKILNTGSTVWGSGSLTFKDTVTSTTVAERITNDFEDWNSCLSASPIQGDLAPGESGSLHTLDFGFSPIGHEILMTIKMCTQDALAGTCLTKTYTFTP